MRLPDSPRARLLQGLLGLTLLLVTAYGMQEKPQSPGVQPRNPLRKAQRKVQAGKDKQPEAQARQGSTRAIPGTLINGTFRSTILNFRAAVPVPGDKKEALSGAGRSETEHVGHRPEENGAEETPGLSHEQHGGPSFRLPFINLHTCDTSVPCRSALIILYVNFVEQNLPNCPCTYPDKVQQGVFSLVDEKSGVQFDWRDASSLQELPHNSSASSCLRSMLSDHSSILASQHCCYDAQGRLLTRGDGVGAPDLISPELFTNLDLSLDHLPWSQCKEEWVQLRDMMPPNNGLSCPENPPKEQTPSQLQDNIEA